MACNDRWAEGWADLRHWRQRMRCRRRRERAEARLVRRWALLLYWHARIRSLTTPQRGPTMPRKEPQMPDFGLRYDAVPGGDPPLAPPGDSPSAQG